MQIAVTVGLDLEPRSGSRPEKTGESEQLAASGRGPRRGKVLIMDDDRMVRETMHRQLAICGYEVAAASRGEDALNAYRQAMEAGKPFDAVILDLLVAAGWGGEQTLVELLKLDPGAKVLVCSGSLEEPAAFYAKQGFCGVIGKPYSLADLRGAVQAALPKPALGGAAPPSNSGGAA